MTQPVARGLAILAFFLVAGTAEALQVLTPADRALVKQNSIVVLGTAPRGSEVQWSVRGQTKADKGVTRVDLGETFEIFAVLEPGRNKLQIGDQVREIFYDAGAGPVPAGFSPQRLHAGDISRCEDCHDLTTMRLKDNGYPEVCLGCHVVESQNPGSTADPRNNMHFQTVVAACRSCHEPHVSRTRALLSVETIPACGKCHTGQVGGAKKHAAYDDGGCVACHDAHFSGFPRILKEPMPGLCAKCHEQGTGIEPKKLHTALSKEESCSSCHEPHGTGQPKLLRSKGSTVCSGCHPKVLDEGHKKELAACGTCHDPHLAKGGGLLKGPVAKGCGECHDDIGKGKTVHAAVQKGCQLCHNPHSDKNLANAKKSCFKCHDLKKNQELGSLHGGLKLAIEECAKCHPAHSSNQEKLVYAKLHYPLTQGKCSVCHGGGDDRSLKVDNPAVRCRLCHTFEKDAQAKGDRIHKPVASGECTACHDPHMSNVKGLLLKSEGDTCRKCHSVDKELKEKGAKIHDPVASSECTACHSPHAGKGKGMFRKSEAETCRECHDGVPDATKGRKLHPAAESCTDCHRPHGGPNKRFLAAPVPELCFNCHDDPRKAGGDVHPALDDGCLGCHDPHAGFGPGSLKAEVKSLCLGCHDDPTAKKPVVHGALAKGCQSCHAPHASKNGKLLKVPGNALCKTCHPGSKDHHPLDVGKVAEYPKAGKFPKDGKEFACSGCHAPHASTEKSLYTRPKAELCVSCHDEM